MIESAAEFARGVDGYRVLHCHDCRRARSDKFWRQPAERVGGAAGGGLATGEKDEAEFVLGALSVVVQQAREHFGKLVIFDTANVSRLVGEKERSFAGASAVAAVADEVQPVIPFAELGLKLGQCAVGCRQRRQGGGPGSV